MSIYFRFFFARYHNVLQRKKKTLKNSLALGVGPSFTGILKHQYLLLYYTLINQNGLYVYQWNKE